MEFFKTVSEDMHHDNSLLQTIKIPKNLLFLTDRLPQANYEKASKKGINYGSSEITIKKKKIINNNINNTNNNSVNNVINEISIKDNKENININSKKYTNSNNNSNNNKIEERKNIEDKNVNIKQNNNVKKSNRDRSQEHSNIISINNNLHKQIGHNNMSQSPPAHGKINYSLKDNKYKAYNDRKNHINKIYNINSPNSESQEVLPNINRGGGYIYNDPRL